MATGNFAYLRNASKYFVFGIQDKDPENYDPFLYDDEVSNINNTAAARGYWINEERRAGRGDAVYFAEKDLNITFAGLEFCVTVRLFRTPGYYEGGSLDYDFKIDSDEIDGDEIDENFAFSLLEYDFNIGFCRMQSKNLCKRLEAAIRELSEDVEKLYNDVCQYKLNLIGRASNGETFYNIIS